MESPKQSEERRENQEKSRGGKTSPGKREEYRRNLNRSRSNQIGKCPNMPLGAYPGQERSIIGETRGTEYRPVLQEKRDGSLAKKRNRRQLPGRRASLTTVGYKGCKRKRDEKSNGSLRKTAKRQKSEVLREKLRLLKHSGKMNRPNDKNN